MSVQCPAANPIRWCEGKNQSHHTTTWPTHRESGGRITPAANRPCAGCRDDVNESVSADVGGLGDRSLLKQMPSVWLCGLQNTHHLGKALSNHDVLRPNSAEAEA